MAFGFIKKVFSFGQKEQPAEENQRPPLDAEAPRAVEDQAVPDFLKRREPAPAPSVEPAAEQAPAGEIEPPLRTPSPLPPLPVKAEIAPEPSPLPVEAPSIAPTETATPPVTAVEPTAEIEPPIRQPSPLPPLPLEAEIAPEPAPVPSVPVPPTQAPAGKVTVGKAVEKKAEPAPASLPAPRQSWFQRLREGLARSSRELTGSIAGVFTRKRLDEETLQDLEDVLIRADLGVETAMRVTGALAESRYGREISDEEVRHVMAAEIEKVLGPVAKPLELDLSHKPHVILVVGVNGTGKTTTIGKLAAKLTEGGLSVMLAAGDTFRAAAIEQLKIWGERTGAPVVSSKLGADAAGLAFDAYEQAKAAGSDVLIIDTAGRLQNKAELMAELEKIVRVLGKHDAEAPHTVLQTVDATTGQNALNQVEIFRNVAGVNGLVMTKLDGTARGGILVAIAARHKLPVYFIGVGEQVDDLEPFAAGDFAKAIAGVA
ncbi:MAG: signal recognition particle-docking protein FtsY [Rhizobiaceae bacterium]